MIELALLWIVVLLAVAFFLFRLVAGLLKLVVLVAAVGGAVWLFSRLRRPSA